MIGGYLSGFNLYIGQYCLDECRFPYSGMSRKEGYASFEFFLDSVDAFPFSGRNLETRIADGGVKVDQAVQIVQFLFIVGIHFVEYNLDGNTVCLGRGEKTVYKGSGGLGIVHRHYEHALVEVGSKNVRLLGKVGGAADDVILPVLYLADKGRTFLVQYDVHIIAYSHGISASYAFQPEVPFDFTFNLPSVVSPYQVPTSGVFYNESPQNN